MELKGIFAPTTTPFDASTGEVADVLQAALASDDTCRHHVYSLALTTMALIETDPASSALSQLKSCLEEAAFRDERGRPIWWSERALSSARWPGPRSQRPNGTPPRRWIGSTWARSSSPTT